MRRGGVEVAGLARTWRSRPALPLRQPAVAWCNILAMVNRSRRYRINVGLEAEAVDAVERMARAKGVSLAAQLRELVDVGISTLELRGKAEIVDRVDLDGGGEK